MCKKDLKAKYQPRLYQIYKELIVPKMLNEFGYGNIMQVPKLEKIVLNLGVGDLDKDEKKIAKVKQEIALITGQMPITTFAKKSIAGFKIRKGVPVGIKVTLRGWQMYEFLDRLINIALPRVKDFHGLDNKSFDRNGNFAFGIKEHIIFPEVSYDNTEKIRGFDIVICTTAKCDEEARVLLAYFNLPIINYIHRGRELWLSKA